MTQTQTEQAPTTEHATDPRHHPAVGLFVASLTVTALGLGHVLVDQLSVGGLTQHLHAIYDPYGVSAPAGPIQGSLYAIGALGMVVGLLSIHRTRVDARSARWWTATLAVLAALVVSVPLFVQEYGQLIIPLQFGLPYVGAWALGVVGTITLFVRR